MKPTITYQTFTGSLGTSLWKWVISHLALVIRSVIKGWLLLINKLLSWRGSILPFARGKRNLFRPLWKVTFPMKSWDCKICRILSPKEIYLPLNCLKNQKMMTVREEEEEFLEKLRAFLGKRQNTLTHHLPTMKFSTIKSATTIISCSMKASGVSKAWLSHILTTFRGMGTVESITLTICRKYGRIDRKSVV